MFAVIRSNMASVFGHNSITSRVRKRAKLLLMPLMRVRSPCAHPRMFFLWAGGSPTQCGAPPKIVASAAWLSAPPPNCFGQVQSVTLCKLTGYVDSRSGKVWLYIEHIRFDDILTHSTAGDPPVVASSSSHLSRIASHR